MSTLHRRTPRRALSPAVLADLRSAYAGELALRLPRLQRAADLGLTGQDVVRDAHALASSSAVVGEPQAAELAREVEARLLDGRPVADAVAALSARLAGWTP